MILIFYRIMSLKVHTYLNYLLDASQTICFSSDT